MSRADDMERMRRAREPREKKAKKPIRKVSEKRQAQNDLERATRGTEKTALQKWYEHIMQTEPGVCWETGDPIDKRDRDAWFGSIAHVLPKALFPSVATHPMNYLILKMWGGTHGQFDSNFKNAMKMRVWPIALKILKILYPLLTQAEQRKLPDFVIYEILKK